MSFSSLPPPIDQLRRVERFLKRLEDHNRDSTEYDDDVWAFFRNCWHLKDWIAHSQFGGKAFEDQFHKDLPGFEALMIAADMANRTKHYQLNRKRVGAELTARNVTIRLGHKSLTRVSHEIIITLADGTERKALEVARQAVADWDTLFKNYGIPLGVA